MAQYLSDVYYYANIQILKQITINIEELQLEYIHDMLLY